MSIYQDAYRPPTRRLSAVNRSPQHQRLLLGPPPREGSQERPDEAMIHIEQGLQPVMAPGGARH